MNTRILLISSKYPNGQLMSYATYLEELNEMSEKEFANHNAVEIETETYWHLESERMKQVV